MLLSVAMSDWQFQPDLLRQHRHDAGVTQEHVARKLCMSLSGYRKWESGTGVPKMSSLMKLAGLFDVSPTAFMSNGNGGPE